MIGIPLDQLFFDHGILLGIQLCHYDQAAECTLIRIFAMRSQGRHQILMALRLCLCHYLSLFDH